MSIRYIHRSTRTLAILAMLFSTAVCQAVVINELRIDQSGADTDEYFELYGTAGESLDGLSYLVIGDQSSNQGYIEAVINLSGYRIAADGFFLVSESSFSLNPNIDLITALNFENNDNVTHMLVRNFSGSLRDDIDADDDGGIDNSLWSSIVDSVALLASSTGGDIIYSATALGPQDGTSPAHIYRSIDQTGAWQIGATDIGINDSPRIARAGSRSITIPEPSTLMLLLPGVLLATRLKKSTRQG